MSAMTPEAVPNLTIVTYGGQTIQATGAVLISTPIPTAPTTPVEIATTYTITATPIGDPTLYPGFKRLLLLMLLTRLQELLNTQNPQLN
jgi:hypothetical protein